MPSTGRAKSGAPLNLNVIRSKHMNKICWICNQREANSGEHIILKSVLDFVMGQPDKSSPRFVNRLSGTKNKGVHSFKNKSLKFKKSICEYCNNTVTQPYDTAFKNFVEKVFGSKRLVLARQKISFSHLTTDEKRDLALYFIKILGCLIVEARWRIPNKDFHMFSSSLLYRTANTRNVYLGFHRDIVTSSRKGGVTVVHFPVIKPEFVVWSIELDWIAMVVAYPHPPEEIYGGFWHLGDDVVSLKLGKVTKYYA